MILLTAETIINFPKGSFKSTIFFKYKIALLYGVFGSYSLLFSKKSLVNIFKFPEPLDILKVSSVRCVLLLFVILLLLILLLFILLLMLSFILSLIFIFLLSYGTWAWVFISSSSKITFSSPFILNVNRPLSLLFSLLFSSLLSFSSFCLSSCFNFSINSLVF